MDPWLEELNKELALVLLALSHYFITRIKGAMDYTPHFIM